jgi:hypothetical protein
LIWSMGPASRAYIGQESTQMGWRSCCSRSRQKSHFCIFASFSGPNCGAPQGHALRQRVLHLILPRHLSESTITTPSAVLLVIAPAGHANEQGGLTQ